MRSSEARRRFGRLAPPLALAAALAACAGPTPPQPVEGPAPTLVGTEPGVTRQDPLTIVQARVEGDRLLVEVSCGGGCREHRLALYRDEAFLESSPVQLHLRLAHDAQGDNCRALVGRELVFSLVPVREAHRKAYGAHGTIILLLHAPGAAQPAPIPLRYQF